MHDTKRFEPRCLTHQLVEDQTSAVGPVCARCKQRLYTQPPAGRCLGFWESQPAAYTLDRQPCFVHTLVWDDFRIRSLHPPEAPRNPRPSPEERAARRSRSYLRWAEEILRERGLLRDTDDSAAREDDDSLDFDLRGWDDEA